MRIMADKRFIEFLAFCQKHSNFHSRFSTDHLTLARLMATDAQMFYDLQVQRLNDPMETEVAIMIESRIDGLRAALAETAKLLGGRVDTSGLLCTLYFGNRPFVPFVIPITFPED